MNELSTIDRNAPSVARNNNGVCEMEAQSSRLSRRSILKVAGAGAALVAGGAACITAPVGVRAQDAGKVTFWVISPFTPDE